MLGNQSRFELRKSQRNICFCYIIGVTNPTNWPGERGSAVVVPANLKEKAKQRFIENQFNLLASDLMALNRSINDQRSSRL
jgi:hypothetical protein